MNIALVQSRNDKGVDKKFCSMLRKEMPDLSDVVQFKPAFRAVFAIWSLKDSWSSKITPRFLTELDGVNVDERKGTAKSCCTVGVAGKTRSSVFASLSCR